MLNVKNTEKKGKIRETGSRKISRSRAGSAALLIFLIITGSLMFLPFLYAVIQSVKPVDEIFIYPPRFFVTSPTGDNYLSLFDLIEESRVPFTRYLWNSAFVTLLATGLHVIFASMAAFPLAKFKFPGSKGYFNFIVVSLLFTTQVTALPLYIVLSRLGLIDTQFAIIFPAIGSSLGLFLMKQFITGIPDAMIEAARVDGAGSLKIFWRIVMPNVKPAWLTCIIFSFQTVWNDEGSNYIYDESLKVLPTMLHQISDGGIVRMGEASAAAVILMIPPILIFVCSQSQILETMSHSGMKD